MVKLHKMSVIFFVLLLLAACTNDEINVKINGEEKTVNKAFIDILTKDGGVAKVAILEHEKVYDVSYKDSEYFIYDSRENNVIMVFAPEKNAFYPITDQEFQMIEQFAK